MEYSLLIVLANVASTSAARRHGVDLDVIRRTAGWTRNSETFAKFYDRNITNTSDIFARAILNS